jgi:hypothetical protein
VGTWRQAHPESPRPCPARTCPECLLADCARR